MSNEQPTEDKRTPAEKPPIANEIPGDGFPADKDVSLPPKGSDQAPHPDKK